MGGLVGGLGTRQNAGVDPGTRDRWFDWLLVLLVLAGALFGMAPFLAPARFAAATGFAGTDVFLYRLAGAATFGYGVGLAVGYRSGWRALRIPIAATAVFNGASILACLAAILGGAQPVVFVILAASILFTASAVLFLSRPPTDRVARDGTGPRPGDPRPRDLGRRAVRDRHPGRCVLRPRPAGPRREFRESPRLQWR
jgi:hypothetical protein